MRHEILHYAIYHGFKMPRFDMSILEYKEKLKQQYEFTDEEADMYMEELLEDEVKNFYWEKFGKGKVGNG
jgi:hypothetical protein